MTVREGHKCPDCGTTKDIKQHGYCSNCSAVRDARHNWVRRQGEIEAGGRPQWRNVWTPAMRSACNAKYRAMWDEGVKHHEAKQEMPERLVPDLTKEQRKATVNVRSLQARLRAQVLAIEDGCRVTGLQDPASLETAHIKPHGKGDEREGVDYDNCILLTPSLHNLFDRGLISFSDDGSLLVSPALDYEVSASMGLPFRVSNPKPFRAGQLPYLQYHRDEMFIQPQQETQTA